MSIRTLECEKCKSLNFTEIKRVPGNNFHRHVDYVDYKCNECGFISKECPIRNEYSKRMGGTLW